MSTLQLTGIKQNGPAGKSPIVVPAGGIRTSQARVADPCIVVIFGASGDLTTRKLVPAIYSLARARLLPDEFAIVGIARERISNEDYQARIRDYIHEFTGSSFGVDPLWRDWVTSRVYYFPA